MIIKSLLDLDMYKISMMQAVLHQFPDVNVEYKFKCRTPDINLSQYIDRIKLEIESLKLLRYTEEELTFLSSLRFIKKDFIEFLRKFKLNTNLVKIKSKKNNSIDIRISGLWSECILFETLILSIVNEIYFEKDYNIHSISTGVENLSYMIEQIRNRNNIIFNFADFGTRRRFSREWHDYVVGRLAVETGNCFIGTSNLFFAMKHAVNPIGTMAHEWLMGCQGLTELKDFQKFALQTWVNEYRGDLGIALSDTVGVDCFLTDFDMYFSKLFDGARHDSGDPYVWCNKLIKHYKSMNINPLGKCAVFSDGLSVISALEINDMFCRIINCSFGIGTSLTNSLGVKPIQIVMKLVKVNGKPVAKISDSPGKQMCEDKLFLAKLRETFSL